MHRPLRTSDVLIALAGGQSDRVGVGAIVDTLRHQAFALLVVVLGLPNCLPMPPPIPLVCGLLLVFVALQIIVGRTTPWLPQRLLGRSVARADVIKATDRALPFLYRLERVSRPRLAFFETRLGMRAIGIILLVIALGLLVSPPFIGQIPLGIAACLVGLGLVERDGAIVVGGIFFGLIGLTIALGFVFAIVSGIEAISQ